jgi:hypothetical protein
LGSVSFFLLISAVAHFYLATIGYGRYVENLKKGMNPVRFYEYALSSSLMIVLIGMLIGIWDLGAIILIFTVNATMNLFGIMMELHNQHTQKTDWTAFIYGCIAGFIPWVVIMLYFVGGKLRRCSAATRSTPSSDTVCLFNIFAINMVLQYKKIGPGRTTCSGTRLYNPEPVGKDLAGWLIWTGTLPPVQAV